jgi:hypothetical protein
MAALAAIAVGVGIYSLLHKPATKTTCVALDVTNPQLAGIYNSELRSIVRRASQDGSRVKILPFAGSPKSESYPILGMFDQVPENARRREMSRVLHTVDDEVLDLKSGGPQNRRQPGSGILEALDKTVQGSGCNGGLEALTDGLEGRDFDVYHADFVTNTGLKDLVDKLNDSHALPNLGDITVSMPYGGVVPQGSVIARDPHRIAALQPLFVRIIEESGGHLKWGE